MDSSIGFWVPCDPCGPPRARLPLAMPCAAGEQRPLGRTQSSLRWHSPDLRRCWLGSRSGAVLEAVPVTTTGPRHHESRDVAVEVPRFSVASSSSPPRPRAASWRDSLLVGKKHGLRSGAFSLAPSPPPSEPSVPRVVSQTDSQLCRGDTFPSSFASQLQKRWGAARKAERNQTSPSFAVPSERRRAERSPAGSVISCDVTNGTSWLTSTSGQNKKLREIPAPK